MHFFSISNPSRNNLFDFLSKHRLISVSLLALKGELTSSSTVRKKTNEEFPPKDKKTAVTKETENPASGKKQKAKSVTLYFKEIDEALRQALQFDTSDVIDGSIPNSKLENSTVSFGGVTVSLGGADATPAFNLSDATGYPTSSLVGTIATAQIADDAVTDAKLADSINSAIAANTAKVSFPGFGTTAGTALEGDTVIPPEYTDADVDAHLNLSEAGINQVLAWSGADYEWVDPSTGSGTGTVTEITTGGGLTGGPITTTGTISIDTTGTIGAGTYGSTFSSVKINEITIDAYGRVTSITTGSTGSGSGTMSSFNVGNATSSISISNNDIIRFLVGSGLSVNVADNGSTTSVTYTNTDRGSSQSIYKNFRADTGGTASASSNNDTIVIAGGTNIETNRNGNTITINATGGNTDTTYSYTSAQSTNDVDLTLTGSDATTNTVKLVAGSNVTLTDNGSNQVTIDAATGTGVGGSGVQNYIPIWTASSTIGDSAIYQDGTNIGINTTSINAALDVNGDIKAENSSFPVIYSKRESATWMKA